ncbi:MAG: hypothetical protein PHY32_01120 [Candidatus Pacebacteria bacterium]|nr:hypothetical protein [Candidatus Paceibacterota bacterium]
MLTTVGSSFIGSSMQRVRLKPEIPNRIPLPEYIFPGPPLDSPLQPVADGLFVEIN